MLSFFRKMAACFAEPALPEQRFFACVETGIELKIPHLVWINDTTGQMNRSCKAVQIDEKEAVQSLPAPIAADRK